MDGATAVDEEVFYDSNEIEFEESIECNLEHTDELIYLTPENLSRFKIYDEHYMQEVKKGLDEVLSNRFQAAEELFKAKAKYSLYHLEAYQAMLFLKATMSFDQNDVTLALAQLKSTSVICQRLRKRPGILRQVAGWLVKKPKGLIFREKHRADPTLVTNLHHVDLIYAESLLLRAMLTLLNDEGLLSLIKSGMNVRSAFMVYKSCFSEISAAANLNDLDEDYCSGVLLGIGAFNVMLSLLPPRVMKCFELLGFSGDRNFGIQQLNRGAILENGLRSPICIIFLLFFNIVVCSLMDLPGADLDSSKILLDKTMKLYPDFSLFHYFKGKTCLIDRDPEGASDHLKRSIAAQSQWNALHHVCYWDLCWKHASSREWHQAVHYASKLLEENNWSKSFYSYMKAVFLYMDDQQDISGLMNEVEPKRQRIAGKSIPLEKFVSRKSRKYLIQDRRLFLPALELMYVMNVLSFVPLVEATQFIETIEEAMIKLDPRTEYLVEDQCLGYLLVGHLLRMCNRLDEAENLLKKVLDREHDLVLDHYIAPWARYELSQVLMRRGQLVEAEEQIICARDKYTHYSLESRLHFKLFNALDFLRTHTVVADKVSGKQQTLKFFSKIGSR
jgi:hypothetical protein